MTRPFVIRAVQFTHDMAMGNEPLPEDVVLISRTSYPRENRLGENEFRFRPSWKQMWVGNWIVETPHGRYLCDSGAFDKAYELLTGQPLKEKRNTGATPHTG